MRNRLALREINNWGRLRESVTICGKSLCDRSKKATMAQLNCAPIGGYYSLRLEKVSHPTLTLARNEGHFPNFQMKYKDVLSNYQSKLLRSHLYSSVKSRCFFVPSINDSKASCLPTSINLLFFAVSTRGFNMIQNARRHLTNLAGSKNFYIALQRRNNWSFLWSQTETTT